MSRRTKKAKEALRNGLIGLGERSVRKCYYPELRERLAELEAATRNLEAVVEERTCDLEAKAKDLEAANARLREADALKSSFLSMVSHEVRTPLTSVLGFAKIIRRDFIKHFAPRGPADARLEARAWRILENLAIIEHEGNRLTRLINDLLDLDRIESGRMEWRDEEINLGDIAALAFNISKGLFRSKPVLRFSMHVEPNLPMVTADPDRILQVVLNLLSNAVKFTDSGHVCLRVRQARPNSVGVEVQDSGSGIPQDELEFVFDKFRQASAKGETGARPQGTGLGLAVCKQIVEYYHGRIWGESEMGKGSTFHVELPAK